MKHLSLALALLLCCSLLCGCGSDPTPSQLDYTTLDMTPYGILDPNDLKDITLTVPLACLYTEQVWGEYQTDFLNTYPKITYMTEGVTTASDTLCFYYTATCDGEEVFSHKATEGAPLECSLSETSLMGIPGFCDPLIGIPLGTPVTFSLPVPHSHTIASLAGKTLAFTVTPTAIRQETVLTAFDSDYILHTLGWQTTLTDPCDIVETFTATLKEEVRLAYEEDLHHAKEDAALDLLLTLYTPTAFPKEDLTYNLHAILNYYEGMRLYDNEVLINWGDPNDVSPSLLDYVMKTHHLATPCEALNQLLLEAKSLTKENMAVAAAFHALGLTIPHQGSSYQNNLAMYEMAMNAILCESNCTILFVDQ